MRSVLRPQGEEKCRCLVRTEISLPCAAAESPLDYQGAEEPQTKLFMPSSAEDARAQGRGQLSVPRSGMGQPSSPNPPKMRSKAQRPGCRLRHDTPKRGSTSPTDSSVRRLPAAKSGSRGALLQPGAARHPTEASGRFGAGWEQPHSSSLRACACHEVSSLGFEAGMGC